jgi:hypothetical protein
LGQAQENDSEWTCNWRCQNQGQALQGVLVGTLSTVKYVSVFRSFSLRLFGINYKKIWEMWQNIEWIERRDYVEDIWFQLVCVLCRRLHKLAIPALMLWTKWQQMCSRCCKCRIGKYIMERGRELPYPWGKTMVVDMVCDFNYFQITIPLYTVIPSRTKPRMHVRASVHVRVMSSNANDP